MRRGRSDISLRVTDFSDRELLAIASDINDRDGVIDIVEVARQIWPNKTKTKDGLWHARHCVAIRFAYMKRALGVIDKDGKPGLWRLTEFGEEFLHNRITDQRRLEIVNSAPGEELELMAAIGELFEKVDEDAATLMRREFQFRAYRRRWG